MQGKLKARKIDDVVVRDLIVDLMIKHDLPLRFVKFKELWVLLCKGKMTQEGRVELCLLIFKAFFEKPILNHLIESSDERSIESSDRFKTSSYQDDCGINCFYKLRMTQFKLVQK